MRETILAAEDEVAVTMVTVKELYLAYGVIYSLFALCERDTPLCVDFIHLF